MVAATALPAGEVSPPGPPPKRRPTADVAADGWPAGFRKWDDAAVRSFESALGIDSGGAGVGVDSGAVAKRLAVVMDFDLTVSKADVAECHHLIGTDQVMPPAFLEECALLGDVAGDPKHPRRFELYGPEDGPERPHAFWNVFHGYMVKHKISAEMVQVAAEAEKKRRGMLLRTGIRELWALCERHDVPVVILSAGIVQVIEAYCRLDEVKLPPNCRVVANSMVFDRNGCCVHMQPSGPPCSRVGKLLRLREQSGLLEERPCAFLVGDKPIDATMAKGYPALNGGSLPTTLSFGFLNDEKASDKTIAEYEGAFDVLPHSGSECGLEMVTRILASLLKTHSGTACD
jgi:2-hydroxy-3-keto-5-methylthiopentenyl-1-phosphate phosphatase